MRSLARRASSFLTLVTFGLLAACAPRAPASARAAADARSSGTLARAPSPAAPVPPAPPPAAPDPQVSRVDAVFAEFRDRPGCAVGVYRAGRVVLARGYGSADLERGAAIEASTVFDVGSVSKQFTAAAIALLVQDGKVSLDDDVRKYVPEVPKYGAPITLRHLLNHTSGLRDYAALLFASGFDEADVTNDDDALWLIGHQRAPSFVPGERFAYSNTGYFLLAIVVKRVTGKPLGVFTKERIFEPLGMSDTQILDDHRRVVPHRAIAYAPDERDAKRFLIEMSNFEQVGDGMVQTTVLDLAKWDANFYAPRVGGEALVAMLRSRGRTNDGKTQPYAMGLVLDDVRGVPREWHNGAWAGYRAAIARFPANELTVAVLCNVASARPEALASRVAELFVPALADEKPDARAAGGGVVESRIEESAARAAPSGDVRPAPASTRASLVGTYADLETLDIRTIALEKDALVMGVGLDGPKVELEPIGESTFGARGTSIRFAIRAPRPGAAPQLVRLATGEPPQVFERIEPSHPDAATLATYAGHYTSDETMCDFAIAVRDGKPMIGVWRRTPSAPLEPITKDAFAGAGFVFRFHRDARGAVTGFTLSTDRTPGLRFRKLPP